MIALGFIDQLLTRVDIVDVVALRPAGPAGTTHGLLPVPQRKKARRFSVSPSAVYHCFGCGVRQRHPLCDGARRAGLYRCGERAGRLGGHVPMPQVAASPAATGARQRPEPAGMHGPGSARFKQSLKRSPEAIAYLEKRGLTGEIAARFALGYAPDGWTPLQQTFDDYLDDNLESAAWCCQDDAAATTLCHRIMFPIRHRRGDIIVFWRAGAGSGRQNTLKILRNPLFEKGRSCTACTRSAPGHPA